jgi:CRISPR-associated protein Cmx8
MTKISRKEDALILEYDLLDLPTTQHKAGLAGLCLLIDSLQRRKIRDAPIFYLTPTGVQIELTAASLQTLMDDLYDAEFEKVPRRPKRKAKASSELEETDTYERLRPKGLSLQALYPDGKGAWLNLWQDMVFNTLRAIPRTRLVYQERANGKSSSLGGKLWQGLIKSLEFQSQGKHLTESLASSLFLGAEDSNAEKVPFRGVAVHNFLLHFWPLASFIFVPRILKAEKSREGRLEINRNNQGFVLAIPEPAFLEIFLEDVRKLFENLPTELAGFRPRAALIDLMAEGGLEYLYHFARHRVEREEISFSISALELYHLERQGHRVRHLAAERLIPDPWLLEAFESYRDKIIKNPLFKTLVLRNLLRQDPRRYPWHQGTDGLMNRWPWPLFILSRNQTPTHIPFFGLDVAKKFAALKQELIAAEGGIMGEAEFDSQLAQRVYRMIQAYVNYRIGKQTESGRDDPREAREKVCSDAFLAIRGRRDQDLVEYFTGTICSVPQFLPEKDYLLVAEALTRDWQRVKNLALLSLSAHSYVWEKPKDKEEVAES